MIEKKFMELLPPDIPVVIGDLPSTTADIVALRLFDGGENDEYFGTSTVFYPVIKCIARNKSYESMRAWIEAIKQRCHRYHDDYFMSIHLVGSPMYLGRGEEKLHEMQITFRVEVEYKE